uniref:Uncharacterized protein n=1 Tax=Arundo donax TaxID=35708 RepID=A0A0A9G1F1_ARUDO
MFNDVKSILQVYNTTQCYSRGVYFHNASSPGRSGSSCHSMLRRTGCVCTTLPVTKCEGLSDAFYFSTFVSLNSSCLQKKKALSSFEISSVIDGTKHDASILFYFRCVPKVEN